MKLDDYEIIEQGAFRTIARRRQDGLEVVIKELSMGRISDWKELELFERQVSILRQLDHPRIPKIVDDFEGEGEGESPTYYLVCERVAGRPLRELLGTLDAQGVLRVAQDVLGVLAYLQSFSPPVLHRNVTVDTVLLDDDGRASLIDFGSVQVELRGTIGGSTVVGTSGYMPPEQLLGRATKASDLYALGATLVHALTDIEPGMLPTQRMKLVWRQHATVGDDRFHAWLDRMIEPTLAERFSDAQEAVRSLGGSSLERGVSRGVLATRPSGTAITLIRTSRTLEVRLLAPGQSPEGLVAMIAGIAAITLAKLDFTLIHGLVLPALAFAFWLYAARKLGQRRQENGGTHLVLDLDRGYRLSHGGRLKAAGAVRDVLAVQTGFRGRTDRVWLATEEQMLPTTGGLTSEEVAWLRGELSDFLQITDHKDWARDYLSTEL